MDNNYNDLIRLPCSLSVISANKLASMLKKAWEVFISENPAYGSPEIKENSIVFSIPRGSQRREDVYRLSIFFESGRLFVLDSWSTVTAFLKARKAKITVDYYDDFSIEPEEV